MQLLRGFSASGRKFEGEPRINHALTAKMARLHRLVRKGLTPPGDKTSLRKLAEEAAQMRPARKVGNERGVATIRSAGNVVNGLTSRP